MNSGPGKGERPCRQNAGENISARGLFLIVGIFYIYLTFRKVCREWVLKKWFSKKRSGENRLALVY
jgi:hypothetical protein